MFALARFSREFVFFLGGVLIPGLITTFKEYMAPPLFVHDWNFDKQWQLGNSLFIGLPPPTDLSIIEQKALLDWAKITHDFGKIVKCGPMFMSCAYCAYSLCFSEATSFKHALAELVYDASLSYIIVMNPLGYSALIGMGILLPIIATESATDKDLISSMRNDIIDKIEYVLDAPMKVIGIAQSYVH